MTRLKNCCLVFCEPGQKNRSGKFRFWGHRFWQRRRRQGGEATDNSGSAAAQYAGAAQMRAAVTESERIWAEPLAELAAEPFAGAL